MSKLAWKNWNKPTSDFSRGGPGWGAREAEGNQRVCVCVKLPGGSVFGEGGTKRERERGEDIIIITVFNPLDTHSHTHAGEAFN